MSNPWGWGGVNRDGLRNQRARSGKSGKGCGKKASSLLFWTIISASAIGKAVVESL